MVGPVLRYLLDNQEGLYVDACLGAAGHAVHILQSLSPAGRLLGIDRDLNAVNVARERLQPFGKRVTIIHADFRRRGKSNCVSQARHGGREDPGDCSQRLAGTPGPWRQGRAVRGAVCGV